MAPRPPLTRARIADIVVGIVAGGIVAAVLFPTLGWPALLVIPLGPLAWVSRFGSFENADKLTEKEITISLDLDPKPDDDNPPKGAA